MNRSQARAFVSDTFTHGFDKAHFRTFVQNLLNHFDESKAAQWNQQYVKDAFKDHVQKFERLGTYTSPNRETLDVLIVHLTTDSKLERARTSIRNFVADHLKQRDEKDAALVAFVSPSESSWRFSYIRMEYATVQADSGKVGVEARLTPARRFSYIVGEGESCHTAQSRFLNLLANDSTDPALAQIEEAFSVEAVTKEFFEKYAELFGDIHAALEKLAAKNKAIRDEFASKGIQTVDFAKKLMGQIVFLYFLQKKGWLGVERGKAWGTGPHDLLRKMASCAYGEYKNFFNDILEPLFYDTLASDRGHEAWCDRFKCRIPFLNGGLFEPLGDYDWRNIDIPLPNELFTNAKHIEEGVTGSGVLDVFDRYNFTVNEAEPLEQEVAIDPEMLGKVFENLIEENRRKGLGAFYTPREIVHYMCQESLINYLHTAVNLGSQTVSRADIETFIHLGEQISHYEAVDAKYAITMPKSVQAHARLLDETLEAITVCDPAVGSGAFPVGMMTEIVRARCSLTPYFNDVRERTPYHFKRHAIQNCLYGVDVDAGAVEIAKLRLWLSLVVDEEETKQIKPLPNLDFKIVIGNSLLGFPFKSLGLNQVEKLKARFFEETDHDRKAKFKRDIEHALNSCFATSKRDLGYEVTFDFKINFSEVFHGGGGFDIVIQNPPYVQIKGIEPSDRRIYEQQYEFATGRFNLFYLFIERCAVLLKGAGFAAFIIPDRLLLNTQCKEIRRWLLNDNEICGLVSFEDQVFETAVVDSILLFFQRKARENSSIKARRKVSNTDVRKSPEIIIPIEYFELSPSSQFDLNYDCNKLSLLQKIRTNGIELGSISETRDGIIQGKVEDKLFLTSKLDDDSKKLLVGRNIQRYKITYAGDWVSYKPSEMMALEMTRVKKGTGPGLRMRNPQIFERPKILTRQTADEIIGAYDGDALYYYANTLHGTTITDKTYHPYYVLGVLNSTFTTWYYRSNTDEEGKVFAQIKIELLRRVPIPKASSTEQKPIIERVSRILDGHRQNGGSSIAALEKEIDDLVYELYRVSQEEIELVEKSMGRRSVESKKS